MFYQINKAWNFFYFDQLYMYMDRLKINEKIEQLKNKLISVAYPSGRIIHCLAVFRVFLTLLSFRPVNLLIASALLQLETITVISINLWGTQIDPILVLNQYL